jgi:SNF2 family DNA or RNA helicase
MPQTFIAKPYQQSICSWLHKVQRSAVFASMGSGKTVSTLTALENLNLVEHDYPVLVIAPLRVATTTWPDELKKWSHLQHLTVSVINGPLKTRLEALKKKVDIYTTNYENLTWLVDTLGKKWMFKTVIADECTRLKGFRSRQGAKRPKSLAKVIHTMVNRVILLTGTPAPNGLKDLWGQIYFIDKGERLGKSYNAFCERWFNTDYSGFNLIPKEHAQSEIQDLLKDICLTVNAEDYEPTDKPITNRIMIDLPPKAKVLYKKMEKEMFAELEKGDVEAFTQATADIKCAQIANGALYLEDKSYEVLHDEKIKALESVVEEAAGMPILVAYRFKSDLERLRRAFPRGRAISDDDAIISAWNAGRVPVLFLHPKSGGVGLNLADGSHIMVFFSVDWSLEDHVQTIERIGPRRQKQAGYNRRVFIHYLLAKDTIDETIMERLETKKTVQEVLLSAMNRYKKG